MGLGPVIKVNGMPDWLDGEEKILAAWGEHWYDNVTWVHCHASPEAITQIRLRADHPYYLATEQGFTYWPGGDSAPGDVVEVLFRDGEVRDNDWVAVGA